MAASLGGHFYFAKEGTLSLRFNIMMKRSVKRSMISTIARFVLFVVLAAASATGALFAQTREKGPWWPSPHGPRDQAGNSNYVTPEKILKALRIQKTGQTYELGRVYEQEMPQYGYRPYFLTVIPAAEAAKEGTGVAQQDYFTGFIGKMGTQYDAFGHQGKTVRMADGSLKNVYYNGFTQDDLTGKNRGVGGLKALGVEQVKRSSPAASSSTSLATRACQYSTAGTR